LYAGDAVAWGGTLDQFCDSDEFRQLAEIAIRAKFGNNPLMMAIHRWFPEFLPEQIRQMAYYHALGVFWSVMAKIFLTLSEGASSNPRNTELY